MLHAVLRLRGLRMVVVLVPLGGIKDEALVIRIQSQFALPAMLVARHDGDWKGAKAWAQFDAAPYLAALLALDEVDWAELPDVLEPELPF